MKQYLLKSLINIYFAMLSILAYSQSGGVSINKTNSPADPSAMLDVSSTAAPYLGMLIPRMSTANRNTIVTPATGLHIFNTDCGTTEYYTGSCWISMGQNMTIPDPITCSGTTDFCANETRAFTIPAVNGATKYSWTVSAGAAISSGQGTTSITVIFGNNSGQVCVNAANICESSPVRALDIHINPVPATPGNITGPMTVVPSSIASYFIASVAGAGVYNWTVPAGATITSGVGTTTITVSFSCNAVSGNILVAAQSNCGMSSPNALAITTTPVTANAGAPVIVPATIGGSPTATAGTPPYTYAWSPLATLSNATVANPMSSFICSTITYNVTVTDANGCTAHSSTIASNFSPPPTPGSISGNVSPCVNSAGNVYSISPVATATSYNWTVPAGASITSGAGTTSITVPFGSTSGNITVAAVNSCGTGSTNFQAVNLNPIPTSTFTYSPSSPARGQVVTFSPTLTGGGITYSWSFPAGSITSSTATSPTVSWSATGTYSPSLTLTDQNGCSSTTSMIITISAPVAITYTDNFIQGQGPTCAICTNWTNFRNALIPGAYNSVTLSSSQNSTSYVCADPTAVNQITTNLQNGSGSVFCNGHTWYVDPCSNGNCFAPVEIALDGNCSCPSLAAIRPCHGVNDSNWGGVNGGTCGAASQTLSLTFNP